MVKMILADDEPVITRGIRKLVDWQGPVSFTHLTLPQKRIVGNPEVGLSLIHK